MLKNSLKSGHKFIKTYTVQRLLRPVGQLQRAEDLMSFQWILPTVSEVHDLNNFWIQMKAAEPAEKNMILIILSFKIFIVI